MHSSTPDTIDSPPRDRINSLDSFNSFDCTREDCTREDSLDSFNSVNCEREDCNMRNAHERDPYLSFDAASHTYHLGKQELKSVTTVVEECFPQFDAPYWAARKAVKEGVDPQVILDRWAREACRARNLGTTMHERIERYYIDLSAGRKPQGPEGDTDAYRLFHAFASGNRLHPYRTEWRIYHEDYGVAGTLDFLERTPSGTFNIYDWKRSKKLIEPHDGRIIAASPYRTMGLHPVSHLPDTSYWHYALQLSIYRLILEERYSLRISGMKLGVFHPAYSTPWIVEVPYLHAEALAVLDKVRNHQP